ncbi:MAG: hypothetical protein ACLFVJ_07275 [Persicimonas sp.]
MSSSDDKKAPLDWHEQQARAEVDFMADAINIHLSRSAYGIPWRWVRSGEYWEKIEEGAALPADYKPAIRLQRGAAQQLMDDLWRAGLRPEGVKSASDVVEAKDAHIDDLRRVIFREDE